MELRKTAERRLVILNAHSMQGVSMKVSEAIAEAFCLEGCEAVFGLLGDANMPLWIGLAAKANVEMYSARHEAAAVAMADGYFRATGRVGIATITSGPGLTQIGTSLVAAARNGSAMVVAVGDVPLADRNNVQKFDQRRFVEACGAAFVNVTGTGNVAQEVAEAFYTARVRRQPVVLNMPTDVQEQAFEWDFAYEPAKQHIPAAPTTPPAELVHRLVEHLLQAERPVVLAGLGAKASGAGEALAELGDRLGALMTTTLKAKGFFAGQAFDAGIAGAFASAPTEQLLGEADFVLGVGAELGYYTTEGGLLFPGAQVARIDTAPWPKELGVLPGLYLQGDAKATVQAINRVLAERGEQREGYRTAETRAVLDAPPAPIEKATDGMDPRAVAARIGAALPDNAVVTIGCGHFWAFFHMYTPVRADLPLYMSYQFGSIGQTLPIALGVSVAHPDRPHLVIEGDGSVMMHIQELETFARHGRPAVVLIWNDSGFGAEVHKLKAKSANEQLGRWQKSPDFVWVARGFGGDGERVDKEEDLEAALQRGFASGGLYVLDVRVSPTTISDPYLKLQFGVENRAPLLRGPKR